ncbi:hypothetical protein RQP46_001343 [Phenoliferia psychrophenolica]
MSVYSKNSTFSAEGVDLPGSDLTVISSDGVIFKVHKKNLECASEVFADMLEVSSSGGSEVTLVEPANVLARPRTLDILVWPAVV